MKDASPVPPLKRYHSEQALVSPGVPIPSSQSHQLQERPRPASNVIADALASSSSSTAIPASVQYRPSRNPARRDTIPLPLRGPAPILYQNRPAAVIRPKTATGSREDVTPWELFPVPHHSLPAVPSLLGTNRATRPRTSEDRPRSAARPNSSGGRPSGIHFPESLVRRRKSTGGKQARSQAAKLATDIDAYHYPPPPVQTLSAAGASCASSPLPETIHVGPFLAPLSPKHGPSPPVAPVPPKQTRKEDTRFKFSTADRTILEELKRNIKARASQFVVKGGFSGCGKPGFGSGAQEGWGAGMLGGMGTTGGRKHHSFPKDEVPYPRSYEREVLDLDVWETSFCQQICDSPTWHDFAKPPKKVLDIGCGTGAWILNAARVWRECHFVGMDIVPLHPDLHQVGSIDLAQRVTWTQGNFLEILPFPNEEFDYVHIKRIALGVPEDKWDRLFEEIIRVMKPGGAFEMIEEDLFFPGRPLDDEDDESDIESESRSSEEFRRRSASSIPHSETTTRSSYHEQNDADTKSTMSTPICDSGQCHCKSEHLPSPPVDAASLAHLASTSTSLSASPLLPPPMIPITGTAIVEDEEDEDIQDETTGTITQASHRPRQSLSAVMSQPFSLHTKLSGSKSQLGGKLDTPSKHIPSHNQHSAGSSVSLQTTSTNTIRTNRDGARPRGMSLAAPTSPRRTSPPHVEADTVQGPKPPPLLARQLKAPANPRDHTILETIYNEMHASRFINLSPLSLLPNYINLYFDDVRSHPPIQFAFPPPPPKSASKPPKGTGERDEDDPDEEAKNAINPFPARKLPLPENCPSVDVPLGDQERWVSGRNLLHRTSQFVSLDDSRLTAVSPRMSAKPPQSINPSKHSPSLKNTMPNKTLNIDVKALNLHLALRRSEILACSEEMWEWVIDFKAKVRRKWREDAARSVMMRQRSLSVGMVTYSHSAVSSDNMTATAPVKLNAFAPENISVTSSESLSGAENLDGPSASIFHLTREDFEDLLHRFDMHMSDHIALASQISECFSWPIVMSSSEPSVERKAFDAACERYDNWQNEQHRITSRLADLALGRQQFDYMAPHLDRGQPSRPEYPLFTPTLTTSAPKAARSASTPTPSRPQWHVPRKLCRTIGVFVAWKPQGPSRTPSDTEMMVAHHHPLL